MISNIEVKFQTPQPKISDYAEMAESLISIGADLFVHGCDDDVLQLLDAAISIIKNPTCEAYIIGSGLLQMSYKLLTEASGSQRKKNEKVQADLYQEDECDVGPRVLSTPVRLQLSDASNCYLLEASILFNKGLAWHSICRYVEAKQSYQSVLCILRNVLSSSVCFPSHLAMEIGMRAENNLGFLSYCEGDEHSALASFESSLLFAKNLSRLSTDYQVEYATVLSNHSRVAWMLGDISDNLYRNLREVLEIRTSVMEWDHIDIAASHYNLAMAEYARQCNNNAIPHILKYLQLCTARSQQGKNDLDPVPGLIYLMLIQNEDKEDNMSQELVRGLRTLQDKRQDQGPKSPEVASVLNYIGTLLFHREEFENALLFFQEELRLEVALAKNTDDISTSVTCNNIGRILQEMGKFREAIGFYQRALRAEYGDVSQLHLSSKGSVSFKLKGKGKADATCSSSNLYSTVWYNLGLIHDKLGSYEDAIFAFEMSLELRRAMLGADHPDIACLLYNIGVLRMEREQLDEASECFREALRVRRIGAAGQLNDRHVVKTLEKLSSLHRAKGNIRASLEVACEVLSIQEVSPDYDSLSRVKNTGITLRSIAELYHAVGNLEESRESVVLSVQRLRCAVVACTENVPIDRYEQMGNIEQLACSLLLLGSLHHEMSEPLHASLILNEASRILACATVDFPSHTLGALHEVTRMLAAGQCAPAA